ncbi:hypothetical protein IG631_19844 [Alternaria alternata]|nr:hypothetical protein IG631_19844 [Alternaria alternata]
MNSQPPASSLPSRNNRIVSTSVSSLGKPSQKFLLNTWPPIGTSLTGLPGKAVLYSPKFEKHNGEVVREVLGHCSRWRKTMKLGCRASLCGLQLIKIARNASMSITMTFRVVCIFGRTCRKFAHCFPG